MSPIHGFNGVGSMKKYENETAMQVAWTETWDWEDIILLYTPRFRSIYTTSLCY